MFIGGLMANFTCQVEGPKAICKDERVIPVEVTMGKPTVVHGVTLLLSDKGLGVGEDTIQVNCATTNRTQEMVLGDRLCSAVNETITISLVMGVPSWEREKYRVNMQHEGHRPYHPEKGTWNVVRQGLTTLNISKALMTTLVCYLLTGKIRIAILIAIIVTSTEGCHMIKETEVIDGVTTQEIDVHVDTKQCLVILTREGTSIEMTVDEVFFKKPPIADKEIYGKAGKVEVRNEDACPGGSNINCECGKQGYISGRKKDFPDR